jgi:hypothetical protein
VRLAPLALLLAACSARPVRSLDRLIDDLAHPDIEIREAASARLRELGPAAYDLLRAHADDADTEIASRCRSLLPPPGDREWYATSDFNGIDLQSWRWTSNIDVTRSTDCFRPALAALAEALAHTVSCVTTRTRDGLCAHGVCAPQVVATPRCSAQVRRALAALSARESDPLLPFLRRLARESGTDFTWSGDSFLFCNREIVFDAWWKPGFRP